MDYFADKVFKTTFPVWGGITVAALFLRGGLLKMYLQWKVSKLVKL